MQPGRQAPSQSDLRDFAERLAQFCTSLPTEQQSLLDTMLIAALRPEATDDIAPYWAQYNGIRTSPNPSWYTGSGAAAWNNTAWDTAWLNY